MNSNNLNPFSDSDDNTSFERGMPVNQTVKNAAASVAKTVTTQTDKQIQDALNQVLYGPSTAGGEDNGTDEANPQASDHQNLSHATGKQGGTTAPQNSNQTPDEQAKMEKIRHELFGNYSQTFKAEAMNGAQNIVTNVDMEMDRERKQREQLKMQKTQEEEQEEEEKKQQEESAQQELAMPAGKKTGMQMGRKQEEPIALRLAKTKAEINRGATG